MAAKFVPSVVVLGMPIFMGVCGCNTSRPAAHPAPPLTQHVPAQIITADEATTEVELAQRAENAMMAQHWAEAAKAYALLHAATPSGPHASTYLLNLATCHEALENRLTARDEFREVAEQFPASREAKTALVRAATLDAYLEQWQDLAVIGDEILQRADIDDVDRLVALGSRGLANIELGKDTLASKDIYDGLDLADRIHYSTSQNVIPIAAAQLRFALGEMRRVRSEKIRFEPLPPDFLIKLEERCQGLLDAQTAYADAVRSVDPHWATMAGYRVGEMYRTLHRDLVSIPAPVQSKTEKQKQIFYAFMHIRYRVLLEKGLKQIDETIALGNRIGDNSQWVQRSLAAKAEMQEALDNEKKQIAKFPFTEDEIKEALNQLAKKVNATQHANRE